MSDCILSSAYLAPVSYYAQMMRHGHVWLEVMDHYQKQSYRNRCIIADANGPLSLTIPIEKPQPGHNLMRDIRISDHGRWRHLYWNALRSAYQNSPFFEYYADDFAPFYERQWNFLVDFNEELQHVVCQLMDIEPMVQRTEQYMAVPSEGIDDLRELIHPRLQSTLPPKPYYQVFRHKLGFLSDLSIIDLLFNMGPEGQLTLLIKD